MKLAYTALALSLLTTPALAGDPMDSGESYGPHNPYAYTAAQAEDFNAANIAASNEHGQRTYDRVRENGGCNADNIPTEIAIYCHRGAFGGPQIGGNSSD